ncbi:polysaccharide lyase [Kitasatospora sp. NPDC059747]|uniref:polysaccharide lyase n=1 Tax=Kitasatospora sp. NPDC059747 TaxID=3346930 RepID=UPI00365B5A6F
MKRLLTALCASLALLATAPVQATATATTAIEAKTTDAASWTGDFTGYGSSTWTSAWGTLTKGKWGQQNLSLVNDPAAPGDGSALQVFYGAGSSANSCSDCPSSGGGQFYTDLPTLGLGDLANSTTLDLKYSLKLPAGFDFGKAGKLPGLYGGSPGEASGGNHGNAWSTRYMWRNPGSGAGDGEVYLYTPTNSGPTGYGVDLGLGSWQWPADGAWHSVEQLVDRGSGDVTVWLDGAQVFTQPGAGAPDLASIPFSGVFFSTFYGGHDTSWGPSTDQYAYFAHFSLAAGVQH